MDSVVRGMNEKRQVQGPGPGPEPGQGQESGPGQGPGSAPGQGQRSGPRQGPGSGPCASASATTRDKINNNNKIEPPHLHNL